MTSHGQCQTTPESDRASFGKWCRIGALASSTLLYTGASDAGETDAWRLMLTWSPEYCRQNANARTPECDEEHYFVNHGLAIGDSGNNVGRQCTSSPAMSDEAADRWLWTIPSHAQILKVWMDEGRCSGLEQATYFAQVDRAGRRVVVPEAFGKVSHSLSMSATDIRAAFVQQNPGLSEESVALLCTGKFLREVQICMDPDMRFVPCGQVSQCDTPVKFRPIRLDRQDYKLYLER